MSTYPPPEIPAASPFPDDRMAKAVAYMAERIGESVRVEQVAAACGLSTFHFSRTFKANVGKAPHGYLTHLRIEQAKVLLRNTDLQVSAVAAQVGFTRLSHFTSTFRRIMGMPPGKYRRERETA
jgi:AraC family transcriptional regulator